jgi:hypothetical protein
MKWLSHGCNRRHDVVVGTGTVSGQAKYSIMITAQNVTQLMGNNLFMIQYIDYSAYFGADLEL